jgi:Ca-activated chloride channel family protein
MKKLSITIILLFGFLLSVGSPSLLKAADRSKIKDGVNAFDEEQWDESLNKFQDALVDDPTNPLLHFNVGDVHYKKKNYEEAINSFEKSLNTNDVSLQEQAYYNLGNSYYKNNKYQEAIDYYKKALELDPNDLDAKYNLELVRAKIKEMADKKPMDNQQQGGQQQQGERQQQQGSERQNEKKEQQSGENQENENQQNHQDKKQGLAEQQNQEQQQQQIGKEEEKKELTKDQAEQILRALRSKEEGNKKLRPMPKQGGRIKVEKDW